MAMRLEAAWPRKLLISKSPHFSYSKFCSSDLYLARDHLGVFSGVMLHACREKSNSTKHFQGQGAPWLPHVSCCPCYSPSSTWCCLWILWGKRGERKVPSQPKPLPIPYSRGQMQSLGLTLGVRCDLGKCLIQRNRLQPGKRRERKTLDCCSGSFLEQG